MSTEATTEENGLDRGTILALVAMALGVFVIANDFTALNVALPAIEKDFDIDAHVRWSDPRAGMGLQFDRVDPADQAAIDEFVDSHFFQPRRRDEQPAE